jgi:FMN phosphatase YigB (HAD superfamily)
LDDGLATGCLRLLIGGIPPHISRVGGSGSMMHDLVVLFDVDNTLIDNDRIQADLSDYLLGEHGAAARDRYWEIFEALREELGYVDYLGALERYRLEEIHDPRILRMSNWLIDYAFGDRLYSGALNAVRHARRSAPIVILSDGDAVFQPRKVERAGLWRAFEGHVLIYVHKETALDDVERLYPARHYVMIDDKLRILDSMKQSWGERLTAVFVRQGRYAADPETLARYPLGDVQLDRIGDLTKHDLNKFKPAS